MLKYEFFPKASDPPLTFGIFEALFSLFPKLFNKNFKEKNYHPLWKKKLIFELHFLDESFPNRGGPASDR